MFRVYLDRLVAEDIQFNNYVDQRETWPFDGIVLYSGWLACGSHLKFLHLLGRVMRKFIYTQTIPRYHDVSAPHAMTRRDMDVMFDDHLSYMVLKEA